MGLFVVVLICDGQAFGHAPETGSQTPTPPSSPTKQQPRVTSQQSITVTAQSSPEEIEDGKINDAYQSVYKLEKQNECAQAVQKYQSVVIPLAEAAKFDIPRNKFL